MKYEIRIHLGICQIDGSYLTNLGPGLDPSEWMQPIFIFQMRRYDIAILDDDEFPDRIGIEFYKAVDGLLEKVVAIAAGDHDGNVFGREPSRTGRGARCIFRYRRRGMSCKKRVRRQQLGCGVRGQSIEKGLQEAPRVVFV